MSAYHPTDDRFTFVTRVRQSPDVDTPFVAVGQAADNIEGVEFRTITKTFLPAVVRGRYSVPPPINGFTFFGPETAQRVAFGDSLAGARSLYNDLFGDFPYQTVSVATIGDNASVAIGAQALILVPEDLCTARRRPFLDTVKEVMTHELAHQYFFNLIGITGPADAGSLKLCRVCGNASQ